MGDTRQSETVSRPPSRGLADVVAASTELSDIDGEAGRLSYRGYDIHDLAGRASFEEITHLLQCGTLPTAAELAGLRQEMARAREDLGPTVTDILPAVSRRSEPMVALRTLLSALAADDPDADDNGPEANRRKAVALVARTPVLLACYHAERTGRPAPPPDPDLGVAANLLLQLGGKRPGDEQAAALDECLVLHADHTMNASTFAARVCAATLADMHAAVTAAVATLKGPLHGGANEAVMHDLESLSGVGEVDASVRGRLDRGEKIMGFGHRVYRAEDPRATHLRRMSRQLGESVGDTRYYDMSVRMERTVREVKGLLPNVDFYAASVYHALGIPTDLFTCVFAVSRMAGWTAHVMEQHRDNRLIRPDSEYVGPAARAWVPLDER